MPGPCGRFSPGGVSAKLTRLRPSSLYPGGPPEGLGHRLLSEPPSRTASSDRAEEGEASAETLRAAQVTRAAPRLGGLCFRCPARVHVLSAGSPRDRPCLCRSLCIRHEE